MHFAQLQQDIRSVINVVLSYILTKNCPCHETDNPASPAGPSSYLLCGLYFIRESGVGSLRSRQSKPPVRYSMQGSLRHVRLQRRLREL